MWLKFGSKEWKGRQGRVGEFGGLRVDRVFPEPEWPELRRDGRILVGMQASGSEDWWRRGGQGCFGSGYSNGGRAKGVGRLKPRVGLRRKGSREAAEKRRRGIQRSALAGGLVRLEVVGSRVSTVKGSG